MRRLFTALGYCGLVAVVGCAGLTSATSGVKDAQSGVKDAQAGVKDGEASVKEGTADTKARAGGAGGPGGGGAPCPKDNKDPDCDGARTLARVCPANEIMNDELLGVKDDKADWRKFDLQGRAGLVKVKIRWDDPKAELSIDLFDAFGANVAGSPGKQPQPEKKLLQQLESGGIYYLRVQPAAGTSLGTVYTVMLEWKGNPPGAGGGQAAASPSPQRAAPAAAEAPAAAQVPPPGGGQVPPPGGGVGAPPAGGAPPGGAASGAPGGAAPGAPGGAVAGIYPVAGDPDHPRCKVVQSFRDDADGRMTLYLDRGAGAGIKVGTLGTLLTGKEGDVPLDGGEFKVVKVVDAQKSIAKSSISAVGKNTRARIDLVPLPPRGY
ncbi:MAG: hypothetical protein EXR72_08205 [Myxococcales bacterium]|nr:hypothetical protein [Myxococcales bacterium]